MAWNLQAARDWNPVLWQTPGSLNWCSGDLACRAAWQRVSPSPETGVPALQTGHLPQKHSCLPKTFVEG